MFLTLDDRNINSNRALLPYEIFNSVWWERQKKCLCLIGANKTFVYKGQIFFLIVRGSNEKKMDRLPARALILALSTIIYFLLFSWELRSKPSQAADTFFSHLLNLLRLRRKSVLCIQKFHSHILIIHCVWDLLKSQTDEKSSVSIYFWILQNKKHLFVPRGFF